MCCTQLPCHGTRSSLVGVERRMQDRCNNLLASATPLVCCGPVTCFNRHSHGGGAGNLAMVLEGIFSDEHGVHAVGINYAIPPAACTGPGVRRAARSGSRPATCRPLLLPMAQGLAPRLAQNPEPGSCRKASSAALDTRPKAALRCGKRPKRAITSRCLSAKSSSGGVAVSFQTVPRRAEGCYSN